MRRLSENDLARIAVLSEPQQLVALRKLKGFKPPHTLEPVRKRLVDLLHVEPPLLRVPKASDRQLLSVIDRDCKTDEDRAYCLPLARAVISFRDVMGVEAVEWAASRWPVGYGHSVCYWPGYYFLVGENVEFSYFDLRLTDALTAEGRRFVLSLMDQRLRAGEPDFEDARLSILKARRTSADERTFIRYGAETITLMDRVELNERIEKTYSLWEFVLNERVEEARRATGTGPLV